MIFILNRFINLLFCLAVQYRYERTLPILNIDSRTVLCETKYSFNLVGGGRETYKNEKIINEIYSQMCVLVDLRVLLLLQTVFD